MIKVCIKNMLLSLIFINSIAIANNILISQGDVNISYDDLDGFSFTIPKKDRSGFFNSPVRIDKTLNTILTMKHVVNYAKSENLLNSDYINKEISEYLITNKNTIEKNQLNDIEFLKLKKFLYNKFAYNNMQILIKDSVKDKEVESLAKEKYLFNKSIYYVEKELRTLQYVTVKYTQDNKDLNKKLTENLLIQLKENGYLELEEQYQDNESISFTKGIDDFYFNDKYKKFSEFVFKPQSLGVIDGILEGEKTYIIAELLKITPIGYKPFDDVKQSIIQSLKTEKVTLKFGDLISKLTQDEINVNEEAILSLKTRYLPNNH